jgi:hypothetical protein
MRKDVLIAMIAIVLLSTAVVSAKDSSLDDVVQALTGITTAINDLGTTISTVAIQGPQGEQGPQGIQGPPGPLNSVSFSVFKQAVVACPIASCDGRVGFDTENYDHGNNYDTSLNRFVAPAAGVYHFDAHISVSNQVGQDLYILFFKINGTKDIPYLDLRWSTPTTIFGSLAVLQASVDLELNQDDYVEVYAQPFSHDFEIGTLSNPTFSGHQVY